MCSITCCVVGGVCAGGGGSGSGGSSSGGGTVCDFEPVVQDPDLEAIERSSSGRSWPRPAIYITCCFCSVMS